jgi:hypothetical protein
MIVFGWSTPFADSESLSVDSKSAMASEILSAAR